jgi:sialic acid synthase SpsE
MSAQFIAEVSSNHHRDIDRCFAFIDESARIGCGAVKFQLFKIRDLFSPEAIAYKPTLLDREAWELPVAFLPKLAERCRAAGVQFSCTPFYLDAVEELKPHVDFYKVASYELLWDDLLIACARTRKPLVLSTGMADMSEVAHAVDTAKSAGCRDLTLLHCVSGYPTPIDECNLAAIETLRRTFACRVGWSDHSANAAVVLRAISRWNAEVIEFHLDLDGSGDEYKTGHCWLPPQIAPVIAMVRDGERADGTGEKGPGKTETTERQWRADPSDGLRPLLRTREQIAGKVAAAT